MPTGHINQPIYIKLMWIGACAAMVIMQTTEIFVSHEHREMMGFSQFTLFVLAACVTLISNKVKFGSYLPGTRKSS